MNNLQELSNEGEVWAQVLDLDVKEKYFYVSNQGRLAVFLGQFIIKKPTNHNIGYLCTNLKYKNRARRIILIHTLVMEYFGPVKPSPKSKKSSDRITIDHLDSNKHNNRLENLEYVTQSENVSRYHAKCRNDVCHLTKLYEKLKSRNDGSYEKFIKDRKVKIKDVKRINKESRMKLIETMEKQDV